MQCDFVGSSDAPTMRETSIKAAQITMSLASVLDREEIYRIRHAVYARELGQHTVNGVGRLSDQLDSWNFYLVAKMREEIVGFISVTPPGRSGYSIEKYVARELLPFAFNAALYEVRLLTVLKAHRRREFAFLLMYAALRWVEAHGGERIVAIGRREILDLYLRVGLEPVGIVIQSGAVTYDLLQAEVVSLRAKLPEFSRVIGRLEERIDWQLPFPFRKPAPCFHGGMFFKAVGEKFENLENSQTIINADVLDAWFPPSPRVLAAVREHLPWLLQTSPPTACEGLVETIAEVRGLVPENILPGSGSSDLIFRALCHWLKPSSHALILDPSYGEYAHVLERVIGCTVDRMILRRTERYEVNLNRLEVALADEYDLVVLVNPNSPTGRHIPAAALRQLLARAPMRTRIWVDETYVDYAGAGQSLEQFAVQSENIVVCKSMSKVYALSGARVAYLCGGAHQLEALRAITPPWVVSLPAQVAAVNALVDREYYEARHRETDGLRNHLSAELRSLSWEIVPGVANFLLCHLPSAGPDAATVVSACREHGLFLRDAGLMGSQLGAHAIRIAVKDQSTNQRMIEILRQTSDHH